MTSPAERLRLLMVEDNPIEEGLRRALERQEFALAYQPKVDVMTGIVIGAERCCAGTTRHAGL